MQILGIHFDPPFLRAAVYERGRREAKILQLCSTAAADPTDVKRLYTPIFKGKVISGLPTSSLLVRSLEIKVESRKHLEEIVAFQSEATSHFESSEILTVPLFWKPKEAKTEATLFTAARSAVRDHLLQWETWGADPDLVAGVPLALVRYAQWKNPSLTDAFIVDLGSSEWSCIWMEQGQLKKSHTIAGGIEALLSSLWEDRKKVLLAKDVPGIARQLDLAQLKELLYPRLSHLLLEMKQELAKILCSFHRISGARPILFTGMVDAFAHLRESLVQTVEESILGEWNQAIPLEELKHAIPIGLALCSEAPELQFRREEFFPQKNWKRAGLFAVALAAASLTLSTAACYFGNRVIESRKSEMVASLQKSLDQWDPSLKRSILGRGVETDAILERWNRAVASHRKQYPFIPQAPKVSEILEWLSRHPILGKAELLSLHYQLVQYPKVDAPADPTQAKVEITFKTKNPTHARQLHESLLQGDERVDEMAEIDWDPLDYDTYRASFFLKNRRSYGS